MESLRLFERVCEVRALRTVFLQTESVQNFLLELSSGHFFAVFSALRCCTLSCGVTCTPFHVLFLTLRNVDIGGLFGDAFK